ncbi:MAG: hypothetical protein JXQ75_19200 [Phycisphaerae bacterium]|nr:hypothetical protein [Phycisphaerae bacterium]
MTRTGHNEEWQRYAVICTAIITLCIILKLPTLFLQHLEYDEQIYWALTTNWLETGSYCLRGTSILAELPQSVYDRPLFHHPPLFSILLAPFVAADSPRAAILISWLGHVLAIVGVAMICWTGRRRSWGGAHFLLWLPVLAVALDPILTFCSRKLWLDDLVGGLAALSMGLLSLAAARKHAAWAAAGGAALGLASLTKLPALILVPAAGLLLWLATQDNARARWRLLLACAVPVVLLLVPWFAVFYAHYGTLLPNWIRPDPVMIETSGLVRRAVSQPWHYYLTESVMVAPVVFVVLVGYIARRGRVWSAAWGVPLVWVTFAVVGLAVLGLRGQGMQLRFLTIAAPGLYAMLAALLARVHPKRSILPLAALLTVIYGAINVGFYLNPFGQQFDEIVSLPVLLWNMSSHSP